MDRHETALNYNRYATPIGKHRERCWTISRKAPARDSSSLADILGPLEEYLSSGEPAPNPTNPTYQAWREVVDRSGPYSHMFTLAFRRTYADQQAISALSDWTTMMNRTIKGPRWKRNEAGLAGVAFAERHSLSLDFRGRLHFHVLIKEREGLPTTNILRASSYATAMRLKDIRGRQMTDLWRIDLREVTDQDRLIGYVLKDIYSQDWQAGDNIAFWRPAKGLDGFQFTPLNATRLTSRH